MFAVNFSLIIVTICFSSDYSVSFKQSLMNVIAIKVP